MFIVCSDSVLSALQRRWRNPCFGLSFLEGLAFQSWGSCSSGLFRYKSLDCIYTCILGCMYSPPLDKSVRLSQFMTIYGQPEFYRASAVLVAWPLTYLIKTYCFCIHSTDCSCARPWVYKDKENIILAPLNFAL